MEEINPFSNDSIAETLKGYYGKEFYDDCKIVYLQNVIIANGKLETIEKKSKKKVYSWIPLTDEVFIGFIKG